METVTTYTPPEIISEMDDEAIHARMLGHLPADIDKTAGGFAYDFSAPAALEKAEMMITINEVLQLAFPEWSYGKFADLHAQENGMKRKAACPAETTLLVEGTPGFTVPKGFVFATAKVGNADSIEFTAEADVKLDEAGRAEIPVCCTQNGTIGNVPESSIVLMGDPVEEITSVSNPEAATGGIEEESDAALIARIIEKERSNDSSHVGCDSDYVRWALEVDGVGSAAVIPEWMGKGSGTVKLIVMDYNGQPANESILEAVYEHIISPDDRDARLAPIGAILTVTTAKALEISISAKVTLEEGITLESVKSAYAAGIANYLNEAKSEKYFRRTRAGSILSETAGVVDYADLLINGAEANVPIAPEDYPTITGITLEGA